MMAFGGHRTPAGWTGMGVVSGGVFREREE